ncbi:MAG TPA: LPS assembly lipoprotein LptE [Rickettsiales bacterium]|nr:LPS assembly lipoprotein LptE [Rickettsiales bacterium]
MWSLRKAVSVSFIACFLVLAGCGFQPMYGQHSGLSSDSPLSGNLAIDPIPGHEGQMLKNSLEDKLNPEGQRTATPDYRLQIGISRALIPAVVQSDGTIQRYNVKIQSDFKLLRTADNKLLLTGHMERTGSYNVTVNANFATYEAEQDVIKRSIEELAEDYMLRLSGYFAGKE